MNPNNGSADGVASIFSCHTHLLTHIFTHFIWPSFREPLCSDFVSCAFVFFPTLFHSFLFFSYECTVTVLGCFPRPFTKALIQRSDDGKLLYNSYLVKITYAAICKVFFPLRFFFFLSFWHPAYSCVHFALGQVHWAKLISEGISGVQTAGWCSSFCILDYLKSVLHNEE